MSGIVNRYCELHGRAGTDGITITHQSQESVSAVARRGQRVQKLTLTRKQFEHRLKTAQGKDHQGWKNYGTEMLVAKVQARLGWQLFSDVLGGLEAGNNDYVVTTEATPAMNVDVETGELLDVPSVEVLDDPEPVLPIADEADDQDELPFDDGAGAQPVADAQPVEAAPPARPVALNRADFASLISRMRALGIPEGMGIVRALPGWEDGAAIDGKHITAWVTEHIPADRSDGVDYVIEQVEAVVKERTP